MAPYFLEKIHSLRDIEALADIRGFGMLTGIDLNPQGASGMAGMEGTKKLFEAGLHVKFTGDCALVAPQSKQSSHKDQSL